MILVFGNIGDEPTAYVCTRMMDRDVDFMLLDSRQYPQELNFTWGIEDGEVCGFVRQGARTVDLSEVSSVYLRNLGSLPDLGEVISPEEALRSANNLGALQYFTEFAPILIVNRFSAMATNSSKPYQAQIIGNYFRVPRTLVTNVPAEARDFYEECRGRVIYKSASGVRSIVKRLLPEDLQRLDQIRNCPTQFQECIPGTDVRVHTVGKRAFAVEIVSDAIDYRYANREGEDRVMRDVTLPSDVAARCSALTAATGLYMGGVDLRRSPDGDYFCFEVNPSPGFTFYETCTGQGIGDALIDLLREGKPDLGVVSAAVSPERAVIAS